MGKGVSLREINYPKSPIDSPLKVGLETIFAKMCRYSYRL